MKTSTTIRGKTVRLGDWVGFKADIEQSGRVAAIKPGPYGDTLTLENPNGFHGEYIGGQTITTERASDCWAD